jgi:DHA2 family multidrug resistance protein
MSSVAVADRASLNEATVPRSAPVQEQWRPLHNPWLIALTVTLATFMEVLDTSIANVALPHIAGDLSAGQDEATWVLTSYLVSNAIVLPMSGWLSTLFGRKRFYMTCVALFTVSSFLCGLAPSLGFLIFFRVLQGIGGGGLQPSEQSILRDTFPRAQQGMAFAVYGIAVVTAPAIGPTLGGWITENHGWRWIFFINIPVGIVSLLLTSQLVSDPPYLARQMKKLRDKLNIDYIGIGLLALGLGSLQVVLDKGEREDWFSSTFITGFTIVAVISLVIVAFWEYWHKDPVVEVRLLAERNFMMANVMMMMLGFVLLGSTVLIPLYLQTLMGYTATDAGLALSPGGFLIMLMMPFIGLLLSKVEARWLILTGLTITALALFHMTSFNLNVDFRTVVLARMFQAAGLAFLFVPINTAAFSYVPQEKNNKASAIINLSRNIGGSFGISLVTTMLARRTQYHQSVLASHTSPFDNAYQSFIQNTGQLFRSHGANAAQAASQANDLLSKTILRQATMLAFIDNFWLVGVCVICVMPLVFFMKANRPGKGGVSAH